MGPAPSELARTVRSPAVVLAEDVAHLLVGWGGAECGQEVRLGDAAACLAQDLLAERLVAPQLVLGFLFAFSLPVFFEALQRLADNQLASVQALAGALDAHDPLAFLLGQHLHQRVNGDAIVLSAHVREELRQALGLALLLLGLTVLGGVRPRVFIAQSFALVLAGACGTLRLAAVSLRLDSTL